MDTILRDVRVGLRTLRRTPISTAVVVVSLGLGVGANTAIYSLAYATLLRLLDLPALDRLFVLSKVVDGRAESFTADDAVRIESTIRDRASLSAIGWTAATTSIVGRKEQVGIRFAAPALVDVMGIAPERGRWFTPDEASRGAGVGVINEWMWRARFGADPAVLGRTLVINGTDITIVGVLPPSFRLEAAPERSDVVTVRWTGCRSMRPSRPFWRPRHRQPEQCRSGRRKQNGPPGSGPSRSGEGGWDVGQAPG